MKWVMYVVGVAFVCLGLYYGGTTYSDIDWKAYQRDSAIVEKLPSNPYAIKEVALVAATKIKIWTAVGCLASGLIFGLLFIALGYIIDLLEKLHPKTLPAPATPEPERAAPIRMPAQE